MDRPRGCPIEFAVIEDWSEATARAAGLHRYFDDELYLRVLYLIPKTWATFIPDPEGFPVVDLTAQDRLWNYEQYMQFDRTSLRSCLGVGVWIRCGAVDVSHGLVNSDTD